MTAMPPTVDRRGAMLESNHMVILHVDDFESGRYATSRILRQAGYEVIEAGTGQQAIEKSRDRPELIVLDVNLPDMSGFDVCRVMKEDPATADIPVLYLSAAYRAPEYRARRLDMGADAYLTQPVDPRELVATVNALLRARQVREAVRESEKRFRSLMTATFDIIWTTDPGGRFRPAQTDWYEFTGQAESEYLGDGWMSAVHPEDSVRVREGWTAAVRDATPYRMEYRLRRSDGEYRHMQVRAVPVLEEDGALREWVGASTDITAAIEAQEKLRLHNVRLQFLSDAADRLLRVDDPREYIEQIFDQLTGLLEFDLYFSHLLDPDSGELRLSSFRGVSPAEVELLRQANPIQPMCARVDRDGEELVLHDAAEIRQTPDRARSPLDLAACVTYPLQAEGELVGTLSFGRRTDAHFSQDELSLLQTVCHQVALALERSRLVTVLEERADALEEANRAKADFLATMSHELRTPLNAMVGYADLLMIGVPEPIPDASKAHVERIRMAALHLTGLIEEVLTHARIEAGHDDVHLETVMIRPLASDIAMLIEPLARKKSIGFTLELDEAPEKFVTDPRKLRQILLNLLGNAVKFTDAGAVRLTIREEAGWIVLEVRDTGIGIDPGNLEKIFEPFWQVDSTKTRRVGGTGLGLGVVRQLAQRLGGDVQVASRASEGSIFTVRLPLENGT